MKLIFVNRFFHPDISATAQMLSDLAFGLAAQGAKVLVITSRLRYDDEDEHLAEGEITKGVRVLRVWTTRFGRASLSARMVDYLSFYLFASFALAWRARRGDIVVVLTDPPLICIPISVVSFLRGAHLVNWAQDIYPEVAGRKKIRIARGIFGLALRILRTCSLRLAAVNVVIGERMARQVRGLRGASGVAVEVIHNWANGDAIVPVPSAANPLRDAWDLAGKFVLEYSGNMGQAHEFETMLGAAEKLVDRPQFVFLFMGGGYYRGWIENEARVRKLSNIRFKPYQPRESLSQSLGVADLHLTSLLPSMEGLIVPSKIYGILAAGRPTLHVGAADGEIAAILESAKAGFTVPPGNTTLLVQRILELASTPALVAALGLNARRAFEQLYNQRIAYGHWARVLLDVDAKALG